ncbi:unnamed protein product [Trypanosoma congolense IL3000]|uniref:WGS project CAEQ00000000 data, annotated contig 2143 n=1 Tax=Trypanosoma congolense (strain IL3000) TaxID=1068625 RepID=F9WBS6_TRYCI|nr:unnamed protein product [Trypanosoma congolense IL3000]
MPEVLSFIHYHLGLDFLSLGAVSRFHTGGRDAQMKPCSPLDPRREAAATSISWKPSVDRPGPSSQPPLSFGFTKMSFFLLSIWVWVCKPRLIAYVVCVFLCSTYGAGDGVIVKKGMWFWMVMVVGVGTGTAAEEIRKNHNHHDVEDLCEVLGAAVIL